MGVVSRLSAALIGDPIELPPQILERYPELARATYRRGGLPVRIGGWALGTSTAAAITLRRTIFLAPATPLTAELLLHELRHVHQFLEDWAFPVSYLWQSIRYGYSRNAYEVDARLYSASRLGAADKEL
ncbi:MAG TPA: DUF4157 domain-containing protein [Gemmatimonadaceae bacterium]|nr:DUF4157 domain-containing protein [Gemmatimonadaceae bacterium]